jgi:hypothetical protein
MTVAASIQASASRPSEPIRLKSMLMTTAKINRAAIDQRVRSIGRSAYSIDPVGDHQGLASFSRYCLMSVTHIIATLIEKDDDVMNDQ